MPEFIPRTRLPEQIYSLIAQMQASQDDPIAAGIARLGQSLGEGLGAIGDRRRATAQADQTAIMGLAEKGLLTQPDGGAIAVEDLYRAMGREVPYPSLGGMRVGAKKPGAEDKTRVPVTPEMVKKYPQLVEGSYIPATWMAEQEGKGKPGAIDSKEAAKLANTLRDELNKMSGDFDKITKSYTDIQAVAQKPSAAGDLSLIFSYMKMLDPGSTVREGEQATAENARGVPATIRNAYNKLMTGEKLSPEQRVDFIGKAGELYAAQEGIQRQREDAYKMLAEKQGVDPTQVIVPRGLVKPKKKAGAAKRGDKLDQAIDAAFGGG